MVLQRLGCVVGVLILAASFEGQQSGQQPQSPQAAQSSQPAAPQGPPIIEIYQIDLDPSGTAFAISKPKPEGDVYVFTAWPDGDMVRLPQTSVKKITQRTKDLHRETVFEIDLVPSGRVIARADPKIQAGTYLFYRWRDGEYMSLRRSDVKRVVRLTGIPAFQAQQEELGAALIGNLPMQGGSAYMIPAPAAAPDTGGAGTVTCSFSNPSYSGYCVVTETIAPGSSGNAVCQDILGCLNNTQCNKTYCNATEIRGGWTLASAQKNPPKN